MTKSWSRAALCVLAAPFAVAAQSDGAAGNAHSEHEQHAAQSSAVPGPESRLPARMQHEAPAGERGAAAAGAECHMGSMHAHDGATEEHMLEVENRLESIERLLQQVLDRESGVRTRDRRR